MKIISKIIELAGVIGSVTLLGTVCMAASTCKTCPHSHASRPNAHRRYYLWLVVVTVAIITYYLYTRSTKPSEPTEPYVREPSKLFEWESYEIVENGIKVVNTTCNVTEDVYRDVCPKSEKSEAFEESDSGFFNLDEDTSDPDDVIDLDNPKTIPDVKIDSEKISEVQDSEAKLPDFRDPEAIITLGNIIGNRTLKSPDVPETCKINEDSESTPEISEDSESIPKINEDPESIPKISKDSESIVPMDYFPKISETILNLRNTTFKSPDVPETSQISEDYEAIPKILVFSLSSIILSIISLLAVYRYCLVDQPAQLLDDRSSESGSSSSSSHREVSEGHESSPDKPGTPREVSEGHESAVVESRLKSSSSAQPSPTGGSYDVTPRSEPETPARHPLQRIYRLFV